MIYEDVSSDARKDKTRVIIPSFVWKIVHLLATCSSLVSLRPLFYVCAFRSEKQFRIPEPHASLNISFRGVWMTQAYSVRLFHSFTDWFCLIHQRHKHKPVTKHGRFIATLVTEIWLHVSGTLLWSCYPLKCVVLNEV